MATVTSISNFDAKDITFSKPRSLGKYEKINISKSDGKKLIIETEECFSRGVQKSELGFQERRRNRKGPERNITKM